MTPPRMSRAGYFAVYGALMLLLGLTIAVSYADLGPWRVVVSMAIAIAKALLVIIYFMNVRDSSRLVTVFAAIGFIWLAILLGGSLDDLLTRH